MTILLKLIFFLLNDFILIYGHVIYKKQQITEKKSIKKKQNGQTALLFIKTVDE